MSRKLNVWGLQIHSGFTFTYPSSIGTLWAYLSIKEDIFRHLRLTGIGFRVEDTVLDLLPEVDQNGEPDIILANIYNWNKSRSVKLLREIKKKYPDVIVIGGGNEIPETRQRFEKWIETYPYFDYVVYKEGEVPLEMIMRKILDEKGIFRSKYFTDCFNEINGSNIIKFTEKYRYLDHREFLNIPSPFTMGMFDEIYEKHKDLHLQAVLETNRGCPYSCTFCDWGLQEKLRKFNIQRIQEEIDWMIGKADEVFIADANFGIFNRDLEIARYFIKSKIKHPKPRTHSLVFSHAKNNKEKVLEIAKLLEKFDLSRSGATFALQSMNPDTLKVIKRDNMPVVTNFDWIAKSFIENGIPYTNELILGLPLETKDSFFDSLDQLLEYNPLSMNTFRLQYLENSEISYDNHTEKYGMKWNRFAQTDSKYDDEKEIAYLVAETASMPRRDLVFTRLIRDMIEVFWMGKITYFIGRFLQKYHNISACTLMQDINEYFSTNFQDWWHTWKISKEDIRDDKVDVPLWYDYTKFKFHRFVNGWLYITYVDKNRHFFYENIKKMCKENYSKVDPEIIDDLVDFNNNMIIDSKANITKTFESKFNWVNYFVTGDLIKEKTATNVEIVNAGNAKVPITAESDAVLYAMAGGHDFLFNKQNCFIYHKGKSENSNYSLHWINKLGLFYEENEFNQTANQIVEDILDSLDDLEDVDKEVALKKFLHQSL